MRVKIPLYILYLIKKKEKNSLLFEVRMYIHVSDATDLYTT